MVVDTLRAGTTGKERWQAKSLRSTFGNQCMSQLPTSPSCGFGSAVREATDKVCGNLEVDSNFAAVCSNMSAVGDALHHSLLY